MKIKVSLSIGYAAVRQSSVLEIDDEEVANCNNKKEIDDLKWEYVTEWANDYIDFGWEDE